MSAASAAADVSPNLGGNGAGGGLLDVEAPVCVLSECGGTAPVDTGVPIEVDLPVRSRRTAAASPPTSM